MGFEIRVQLLRGFKLTLSKAFQLGLLYPEIMENDDYQLISDYIENKDQENIDRCISSQKLKDIIYCKTLNPWNIYILTSSQENPDLLNSYVFLYNWRQILSTGRVPDYETYIVSNRIDDYDTPPEIWTKIKNLFDIDYHVHYLIESSY